MWEDANYCWVVLCKNHWFHMKQNVWFRHKIPLAETDAVAPLPPLGKHFKVRCDDCRKTYTYRPKDVKRVELELPESFKPHPLFQEETSTDEAVYDSSRSTEQEPRLEEPRLEEPLQEGRPHDEPLRGEAPQDEPPQKESPEDGQTRAKGA